MMRISIVNDSRGDKCEAHCSIDWSEIKSQELAAKQLNARFGDKAAMEYIDIADPQARQQYPELLSRIETQSLPLPLLALNGEPRITGYFDIRMLIDVTEAELEVLP